MKNSLFIVAIFLSSYQVFSAEVECSGSLGGIGNQSLSTHSNAGDDILASENFNDRIAIDEFKLCNLDASKRRAVSSTYFQTKLDDILTRSQQSVPESVKGNYIKAMKADYKAFADINNCKPKVAVIKRSVSLSESELAPVNQFTRNAYDERNFVRQRGWKPGEYSYQGKKYRVSKDRRGQIRVGVVKKQSYKVEPKTINTQKFINRYGYCSPIEKKSKKISDYRRSLYPSCRITMQTSFKNNDYKNPQFETSEQQRSYEEAEKKFKDCISNTVKKAKAKNHKIKVSKIKITGTANGLRNTKKFGDYNKTNKDDSFLRKNIKGYYSSDEINSKVPSYKDLSLLRAKQKEIDLKKDLGDLLEGVEIDTIGKGLSGPCPYNSNGELNGEYSKKDLEKYNTVTMSAEFKVENAKTFRKELRYSETIPCYRYKLECNK